MSDNALVSGNGCCQPNERLVARLSANIGAVRSRIAAAAIRSGRNPEAVRLVAVCKGRSVDAIRAALAAGITDLGENRVEEAVPKMAALAAVGGDSVCWHMVGHVQSRKGRAVVQAGFALIHSVDSLRLAERLSRCAVEAGRRQPILLECNVSGESSKAGFVAQTTEQWEMLMPEWERLLLLPGVQVLGLMTMAPAPEARGAPLTDPAAVFARLRQLREYAAARLPQGRWDELSMGMTDDFDAAVAEGATIVRIGRAIFDIA